MKWLKWILIVAMIPWVAEARPRRKGRKAPPPPQESVELRSEPPATPSEPSTSTGYKLRGPYWSAGAGMLLWQEAVQLNRGASLAKMQTQFKGLILNFDYNRTLPHSYWQQFYSVELGYGILKGQGDQTNIPDRLDNQSWFMAVFKPGLIYRTSPVSRMGLIAPLIYRKIQWNFNPGSNLTASDKAFSAGLGLVYIQRLSLKSALNLSLIHQRMWATNLWSATYSHDF